MIYKIKNTILRVENIAAVSSQDFKYEGESHTIDINFTGGYFLSFTFRHKKERDKVFSELIKLMDRDTP